MERTRKAVYPVHKLDRLIAKHVDDTDVFMEHDGLDFHINKHYFDYLHTEKHSVWKEFVQLVKPDDIQKGTMHLRPLYFSFDQSHYSNTKKLGLFDDTDNLRMIEINNLFHN